MTKFNFRRTWKSFASHIGVIVILLVGLWLIVAAARDMIMLGRADFSEYQGNYTFYEKRYARNTSYRFVLDNGDVISVAPEYVDEPDTDWTAFPQLSFRYFRKESLFLFHTHTCVSITSADGEIVFVQEDVTTAEARSLAILLLIIGASCVVLSGFPLFFYLLEIGFLGKKKNRKRNRKKKEQKSLPLEGKVAAEG